MSLISEQCDQLMQIGNNLREDYNFTGIAQKIYGAVDTIQCLSTKLQSQNLGWDSEHGEKPKTNADMIRSMSVEDLACNIMCPNEMGRAEIECDKSDDCDCYHCCLEWLQKESGE